MNKEIDYGCFSGVKATVMSCRLEQEDQEFAFKSLVNCLVFKRVCQANGTVCRSSCLSYFNQICSCLEKDELELMIDSVESLYNRFIFAPGEKFKSLYSEFQKRGIKSEFNGVPVEEIYEDYREKTGHSPYEKVSREEIDTFLYEVEPSMYALA